jgi:hypothetical protein
MKKGQGREIYASKDVFEGKWKNGKKEGKGILKVNSRPFTLVSDPEFKLVI